MTFDAEYMAFANRYAEQPFWLYEVGQLLSVVRRQRPVSRILDVGCNDGAMAAVMLALGVVKEAHGFDVNAQAVAVGARLWPSVKFRAAPQLAAADYEPGYFDVVVSLNTLGHMDSPDYELDQMHLLAKKGATLAVVVPNRRYYQARYWPGTAPGDATQRHEWSAGELESELLSTGWWPTKITTFGRSVPWAPWIRSRILMEATCI